MIATHFDTPVRAGLPAQVKTLYSLLGRFPLPVLNLLLRIGVALVFWKSGMVKIANWDLTVALFTDEYQVPILAPDIAATLAVIAELICPILLVFGLGARLGAIALLSMTLVIQIFVYPENWSEHLLWASILLYVLTRGAGVLSIDHALSRWMFASPTR